MIRRILSSLAVMALAIASNHVLAEDAGMIHWNADPNADIFKIGGFDESNDAKTPKGWHDLSAFGSGNATLSPRGGGILSLKLMPGDTNAYIETQIDVPQDAKYLTLIVRFRGPTLERTAEPESGAGVKFSLIKGDSERSTKRLEPSYEGYRNWSAPRTTMQVMAGENRLKIRAEITKVSGTLEVDSILVIPSDILNEPTKQQEQQLNEALEKDDPDLIRRLVEADPHMLEIRTGSYDNGTPLIRTAWLNGSPKVAAMLVKLGANLEAKDTNWGNTPLRWCCWWGVPEVAEVLLEAGADANGAAAMARSSKTNNPYTKRQPEDYDRTVKAIEDHLAKSVK